MKKRTSTLAAVAVLVMVSVASGANTPPAPTTKVPGPTPIPAVTDITADFSGKALLANPALMKEIDDTLIRAAACRTMAPIGYANGYQCPAAGLPACMKMLKDGKVDACAQLTGRDYPAGCNVKGNLTEATSPEMRANSTCADLSPEMWKTLAVRLSFAAAKARLQAFGCVAEAGTTFFCKSHVREWLCQPYERAGVVTCRPPKLVKTCGHGDVDFANCHGEET